MPPSISAPARRRWPSIAGGTHAFAETSQGREAAADHRRAGRAGARRTAPPCWRSAAKAALAVGAVKDGWNGFNVLHTAAARVGGLDLGFVPGEGGLDATGMLPRRRRSTCCSCSAPTRSTVAGRRLRGLPGHPRRPRRAPRRRHPAGRGLHREVGHLRQHRGPRAARPARRLPAGRATRGLGDPARAVGARSARRCPIDSLGAAARRRCMAAHPHLGARSTRSRRPMPAAIAALAARRRRCRTRRRSSRAVGDFYLTNPIARASARHGRVLGAGGRARPARRRSEGDMSWLDTCLAGRRAATVLIAVCRAWPCWSALLVFIAFLLLADRKIWAAVQLRARPQRGRPVRPAAVASPTF